MEVTHWPQPVPAAVPPSVGERYRRATAVVLTYVGLGLLPVVMLFALFRIGVTPGYHHAVDFHTFWRASALYAHREDPYPRHPAALTWKTGAQTSFVYPPPLAAALAPLTFLPYRIGVVVFLVILVVAAALALRLFGVTDWRCYGAAFLWPPLLSSISIGTISPLLLLGTACLWRWRDRAASAATATAALVAAKLFLWPLLVWLVVSGRRRAAIGAVAGTLAACALSWAWIGFAGLSRYPVLVHRLAEVEAPKGYDFLWLIGGTALVCTAALALLPISIGMQRRGDVDAFALGIFAALLLTPILWNHYLLLLAAVIAVTHRRFGVAWLFPIALWLSPGQQAFGSITRVTLVGVVVAAVALAAFTANLGQGRAAQHP